MYYKDILKGVKKLLDKFNIKSKDLKPKDKISSIIDDFNDSCLMLSEEESKQKAEEEKIK